jgi:F420-0:gamma-glutamyl ligase-like protein
MAIGGRRTLLIGAVIVGGFVFGVLAWRIADQALTLDYMTEAQKGAKRDRETLTRLVVELSRSLTKAQMYQLLRSISDGSVLKEESSTIEVDGMVFEYRDNRLVRIVDLQ